MSTSVNMILVYERRKKCGAHSVLLGLVLIALLKTSWYWNISAALPKKWSMKATWLTYIDKRIVRVPGGGVAWRWRLYSVMTNTIQRKRKKIGWWSHSSIECANAEFNALLWKALHHQPPAKNFAQQAQTRWKTPRSKENCTECYTEPCIGFATCFACKLVALQRKKKEPKKMCLIPLLLSKNG